MYRERESYMILKNQKIRVLLGAMQKLLDFGRRLQVGWLVFSHGREGWVGDPNGTDCWLPDGTRNEGLRYLVDHQQVTVIPISVGFL